MENEHVNFRAMWAEAHKAERSQREEWNKLTDWVRLIDYDLIRGARFLVRLPGQLPHMAYRDLFGYWGIVSGDIWPLRVTDEHQLHFIDQQPNAPVDWTGASDSTHKPKDVAAGSTSNALLGGFNVEEKP
jgi:hypothetical protein